MAKPDYIPDGSEHLYPRRPEGRVRADWVPDPPAVEEEDAFAEPPPSVRLRKKGGGDA